MGYGTIDISVMFIIWIWSRAEHTRLIPCSIFLIFPVFPPTLTFFLFLFSFFFSFLLVAGSYPLSVRLFCDLYPRLCYVHIYGIWII